MVEIFITILLLFFICGTIIAIASRRFLGKGFSEFAIAGHRVGGFLSAMTYAATTYSAFMMVGLVGLTYATGIAALGFELVYLVATLGILSTIGITIWGKARERGWVSPSQMIGDLYGSRMFSSLIAILYIVTLTPYLAAQLKGIGEIFNVIGIGYDVGVIFMAIVTFLWIFFAGIWSIATTDAFQGMWMLMSSIAIILWSIMFLLPSANLSLSNVFEVLLSQERNLIGFTWTTNMFIGMSLPWIFFALTNPQVVQRLYIPRDNVAYRRMVRYFAIYGFIYTLLCIFLGLIFRSYIAVTRPDIELQLVEAKDSVTPTILFQSYVLLSSTSFVGIIAAAISTTNSIVLTVASCIVRDIYIAYSRGKSEEKAITITYIVASIMIMIASIIALNRVGYVVELSVISSALLLPLTPITVIGIYMEPKRRGLLYALTSLITGLTIMGISVVNLGPYKALTTPMLFEMPAPLWCLITSCIPISVLAIKKRLESRKDKETL